MVLHQPLERVNHMTVSHVPGFGAPLNHGAIVAVGVVDDPGILLGV